MDHGCRCKDRLHRARQPLAEWLCRELQLQAPGRAAGWRDLLHAEAGADRHCELAAALQHDPAALCSWLSTTRARGRHARALGCATPTSFAERAPAGAKTNPQLTCKPDHLIGAGHWLANSGPDQWKTAAHNRA